jgi:ubiquinone/menaquinone biosynthesis C-methylase UbiE
MNWRDFWNRDNPIYVNERHKVLHYDRIARGICDLIEQRDWLVLDHGSGEALSAATIAQQCGLLYLHDAAPNVQMRQHLRFDANPKIVVLSSASLDAIADHSLDMVVANSLAQYLTHAEFEALLDFWRRKLKIGGKLVLADILPRQTDMVADVTALLRFASQGGFFFAACVGLVATFFSDYRKLRSTLGITSYDEHEIHVLLASHGFAGVRAGHNLGHNQTRMMFVARAQD